MKGRRKVNLMTENEENKASEKMRGAKMLF